MPDQPIRERAPNPRVGICSACRHAAVQRSARGSEFWRCKAADSDARLMRYPPLPVVRCAAFEEGEPGD